MIALVLQFLQFKLLKEQMLKKLSTFEEVIESKPMVSGSEVDEEFFPNDVFEAKSI